MKYKAVLRISGLISDRITVKRLLSGCLLYGCPKGEKI